MEQEPLDGLKPPELCLVTIASDLAQKVHGFSEARPCRDERTRWQVLQRCQTDVVVEVMPVQEGHQRTCVSEGHSASALCFFLNPSANFLPQDSDMAAPPGTCSPLLRVPM